MIAIEMRGRLSPVNTAWDMADTLNAFNLAAAQGKQFVLLEKDGGGGVALNVTNILTIEEIDDAGFLA